MRAPSIRDAGVSAELPGVSAEFAEQSAGFCVCVADGFGNSADASGISADGFENPADNPAYHTVRCRLAYGMMPFSFSDGCKAGFGWCLPLFIW